MQSEEMKVVRYSFQPLSNNSQDTTLSQIALR